MPSIYLIRHGQKQSHAGDPGLTELGKIQARETGEYLTQFPISAVLTSPYLRAVETAEEIGKALQLPYTVNDALEERMNWVDDGSTKEMFLQEWTKATRNRDYKSHYGETSRNTGARIQRVIETHMADDSHLVLVTHGGAILDYLRNIFGDEPLSHLRCMYPAGEDFQMYNCAINSVVFSANPELQLLNFTEHLSELTE